MTNWERLNPKPNLSEAETSGGAKMTLNLDGVKPSFEELILGLKSALAVGTWDLGG